MKRIIGIATLCLAICGVQAQTKVIAHRGYWKSEGSAQNSISSLKKAAEIKVYGSEFDVQLTRDRQIVVCHDDTIAGLRIGDVTYNELKDLKLKNGERIPTLDDYLQAGKSLKETQLILEIKPRSTVEEENEAVSIVVRKVKEMNMESQVEYISFSMNICEQLAKLTLGSGIAYLKGDMTPTELKEKGLTGLDYHYRTIETHPEWVEEAHRLGMTVNVWTVNAPDMMRKLMGLGVDFITTDQPEETLSITQLTINEE